MQSILPVVREELLTITSLPRQIGALYLYYAMFHKQPLHQFVRMRMTPLDCDKLIELFQVLNSRPQTYRQPLLILSRLWREDAAFLWVAEETEELKVVYSERCPKDKRSSRRETLADFKPLNLRLEMEDVLDREEGLIAGIEVLEVAYNEMKEELGRNDPMLDPSTVCATINENMDKIAGLLNRVDLCTKGGQLNKMEKKLVSRRETRKERVLKKITELQKKKNTLKEELSVENGVVIEEENELQIDTSFLCRPNQKKPLSYATKCAIVEEDEEEEENIPVEKPMTKGKAQEKKKKSTTTTVRKTATKRKKSQSKKASTAPLRRSKRRRLD